jgi:hypothetical protein
MRWRDYVLTRGAAFDSFWAEHGDQSGRRILFLVGRGFDPRTTLGLIRLQKAAAKCAIDVKGLEFVDESASDTSDHRSASEANWNIIKTILGNRGSVTSHVMKFRSEDGLDFTRTGLMGHSRGAECVIAVTERINLGGVTIPAVLSLAPINSGATSGKPKGYAFMTFLPAADGDVSDNAGAQFYDQAVPSPFKVQLYIDHANHNYFNRQWLNDDTVGGLPIMLRPDHERILSTYGCAFFRHVLHGDDTLGYLDGTVLPAGVQTQNVHLAYDFTGARTVDNYESHPITIDNDGKATAQLGGLTAHDFAFAQTAGAFNQSFFGDTTGNVSISKEAIGDFREPLAKPTDLTHAEVRVRAAEVYQAPTIPPNPTGFRVGVEDTKRTLAWIDVDDVGGLPRPFDRSSFDLLTKTMLSTFRFRTSCFAATDKQLNVSEIIAIHLGLNRGDGRPIAFDDIEIVKT